MLRHLLLLVLFFETLQGQNFTHSDSLKGTYGPARIWWDVTHYDLHVRFRPADSTISGFNVITYKVLGTGREMQLDLMQPLIIDSMLLEGAAVPFRRDGNAYFLRLEAAEPGAIKKIRVVYHGRPVQAKNPPWDGGVVWSRSRSGDPWISVACQGMAAQAWFPNKDHMLDEVDSASMHFTAEEGLFIVSNGRLTGIQQGEQGRATFSWKVHNPINNYNIIPYIGKYIVLKDTFNGERGMLDLEFWVLQEDFRSAQKQFEQVKPMLRCFEHWFGPYPFYEDGYKLVQSPYLGMEHQSAIAYGNGFVNGYKGRDLSGTGWGLKWDFIIVHESGHEWFGNNISAADVADNWVHEGFTAYSESLFTEMYYGKTAGAEYVRGTRASVLNDKPIISAYGVNAGGSIDLYYKAANMLHTIRQIVNNDSLWRYTLRGMNREFRHKTVSTRDIETFLSSRLRMNLQHIFDQYLRDTKIPVLEYRIEKNKLYYRWQNCTAGFDMPVRILVAGQPRDILPAGKWKKMSFAENKLSIDPDYFFTPKQVSQ